jgi:signal transduction histidine kinase
MKMSELPLTDRLRDISVLDLSGVAVNLLVCGLTVYLSIAEPAFPSVLGLCLLVLCCFCVFLLTPPSQRLKLLCLFWLQAVAITGLFFLVYNSFVGILGIVWIVQAANLYGPGRASLLLALNITLLFLSMVYHSGIDNVWNALISALSFALFQVFALGAMYQAINERLHREKTATLNRELLATRELLSQTSAQSERLRIARDLHDILGHHMTALILNLEVAKHKLEGDSLDKVEQSLALAKLLLGDLRSTVGDLRADDRIDLQQSLRKLVQGIPNMTIELDCDQAPQINDVDKAETLLRCAQEGLTNVLRHSDAQHCRISLGEEAGRSLLIVEDDGKAKAADIKPGNGLKGMQERLQAAGGALAWTRSGGGFQLRAELPLE